MVKAVGQHSIKRGSRQHAERVRGLLGSFSATSRRHSISGGGRARARQAAAVRMQSRWEEMGAWLARVRVYHERRGGRGASVGTAAGEREKRRVGDRRNLTESTRVGAAAAERVASAKPRRPPEIHTRGRQRSSGRDRAQGRPKLRASRRGRRRVRHRMRPPLSHGRRRCVRT
jgi:hypothetical protein